jgi:hypothetical protein
MIPLWHTGGVGVGQHTVMFPAFPLQDELRVNSGYIAAKGNWRVSVAQPLTGSVLPVTTL